MSSSRLGVAGAGTMGAGIAQLACLGGFEVALHDPDPAALERGAQAIASNLDRGVERGRWSAAEAGRARTLLAPAPTLEALRGCGLVIEAAPESLELKRGLFADLERACGPDVVLATNTSSLPVAEIAERADHPERICGMHFFNPPALMRLVELVAAPASSPAALETAEIAAERMGRTVVRCADSPGFVVNRCNRPFALESMQMLGEGVATAAQIDAVVRDDGGYPMGPFELVDLIGVDVNLEVARSFFRQRPEARWRPHPIQVELVERGRFGRKRRAGFYDYAEDGTRLEPGAQPLPQRLRERVLGQLVAALVNEACFAAGEGVAEPGDIDTAMRLGLNHPRGPFEWGKRVGPGVIVERLERLAAGDPDRYRVAPDLRRWADEGRRPGG